MDTNQNENQEMRNDPLTNVDLEQYEALTGDLGNFASNLASLTSELNKAKEMGASPEEMDQIIENWKDLAGRTDELAQQYIGMANNKPNLSDKARDVFREFAGNIKTNVNKGLHLMTGGVGKILNAARDGAIVGGVALTEKIKALHVNVSTIVHQKAKEISIAFQDKMQEIGQNLSDRADKNRIEEYVKSTNLAEQYKNTPEAERVKEIYDNRDEKIEKINAARDDKLAKNQENYDKAVDLINQGGLTRGEQFAAGARTMADSILGRETRDYVAEKTSEEGRAQRLEAAQNKFDKANSMAGKIAGLKTAGVEKAADFAAKVESGRVAAILKRAEKAEANLDKIKNPEIRKNLQEEIQKAQEKVANRGEARAANPSPTKDMDMPQGPGGV